MDSDANQFEKALERLISAWEQSEQSWRKSEKMERGMSKGDLDFVPQADVSLAQANQLKECITELKRVLNGREERKDDGGA